MALEYSVTDLPPVWPGKKTTVRRPSPFKTTWTTTLKLLDREIKHLNGRKVEVALDLPRGLLELRQDGQLRADARPRPAVILSFIAGAVRQAYPCDTFAWWQDNLYAIARALEALRLVERYGVQSELVRAGFKALPASTVTTLSTEQAADLICRHGGVAGPPASILANRELAREAIRVAMNRTHPDNGGRSGDFALVGEARRILTAHHGGEL